MLSSQPIFDPSPASLSLIARSVHRARRWLRPGLCRGVASFGFVLAMAVAFSCADDAAPVAGSEPLPSTRRTEPTTSGSDGDAPTIELPSVDVAGRVLDDGGDPVLGRGLVIVDRRGRRRELVTDEAGAFHSAEVATPYDLLVEEASRGTLTTPLVYLGLRRSDPRLEIFERWDPAAHLASQPLRIGIELPACRAGSACWISVVSASPTGGGGTAASYVDGTETAVLELEHAWREPSLRPGESIDVHVLVGDADYTEYAYAHVAHISARPGEHTEIAMAVPMRVASTEPVTVAGHAVGLPEGWQWTLASQLDLPGGASIPLRYEWAAVSAMRLPALAGASWHVGAWTQHPPTPDRPYFHQSSQAWTGTLPLGVTSVSLYVPRPPEVLRPAMEGQLSRGKGLAWNAEAKATALASLVIVDLARGRQRLRAFSTETELSLRRFEALGLPRLERGEHVLDLTSTPGADIDELTEPDAAKRLRRFDVTVPGSVTHQRVRFVVTP